MKDYQLLVDVENMSNLTSASADTTSVSSLPSLIKKKRNLPGNPDPDAEVIALSPKTLMATNRFLCEVCNKGFQRDQNLQLHRRGHNLPWKLKQKSSKEARKKVYICPEVSCVHNDPARALGDLTGIKKHFSRKHGEKKWKCDKCAKKYAVQSDWKAHSKICGTREYRCDCGTLFSRRDSFITHRAFCDALAEESKKSSTDLHHPFLFSNPTVQLPPHLLIDGPDHQLKLEQTQQDEESWQLAVPSFYPPPPAAHMSATALLQKAAEMGSTMSRAQSQMTTTSVNELGSMTRDFLGLRSPFLMDKEAVFKCMSSSTSTFQQTQHANDKPWST